MIKHFLLCLVYLFFEIGSAYAISDEFTIGQQVGIDSDPPTTPTLISAIPVAETQIDLTWSSSTDDFGIGGYEVFRDSVQIATTSLLTYSDTGLVSSTTYSYAVRAFDSSSLYSSSSNAIATTTLAPTPTSTPTTTPPDTDAREKVKLVSLEVIPNRTSATIMWETNRYVQFELRWGRTASYELGFVTNELFKREHASVIDNLNPGTVYTYQLVAYDRDGKMIVLSSDNFRTRDVPDETPPANVGGLRATIIGDDVALDWDNPSDADFSHLRIVRSYLFYPLDPYNGFIAYQGTQESFTDKGVLRKSLVQYYTVFSYDTTGNVSSGASVRVSEAPYKADTSAQTLELTFADIEFLQEGKLISADSVTADLPLTVRIPYEKLPEHLKSIVMTLSHPDDPNRTFTFLLRIDREKTYYQATLAPLKQAGFYPMTVSIYDFEQALLYELNGTLRVWQQEGTEEAFFGIPLSVGTQDLVERSSILWFVLLVALLLWMYRLLHDLFVGEHVSKGLLIMHTFALLVSACGIALASYIMLGSFKDHGDVSVAAAFSGAQLPLDMIALFAVACLVLVLCTVALFAILAYKRARRKK